MTRRRSVGQASPKARKRRAYRAIDVLTATEAQVVLHTLLAGHPTLVAEAEQAANALLKTVAFTTVADSVFAVVQALDWDDVRAGPQPGGYVEPTEAAWGAIEDSVKPYLDDLERRITLRHEDEAFEVCKGIVVGLYRAERRRTEFMEHAEDCPSDIAARAVEMWRRRNRARTFSRAFVERYTPEWEWLIR